MFYTTRINLTTPSTPLFPTSQKLKKQPQQRPSVLTQTSNHHQNPIFSSLPPPNLTNNNNPKGITPSTTRPTRPPPQPHLPKTIILTPPFKIHPNHDKKSHFSQMGSQQMLLLCGFGCWVQGFRCFPWLGLNFHMAHYLHFQPSTLQLVQNCANLPMVAKPLYGVLSDALYINGAHRIPYITIGVVLQILSWGTLALTPAAAKSMPFLMALMLSGNLGASITEVATDALIAEYGQKWKMNSLQSYAFMAFAAGGMLGNLFGGYFLLKTQQPMTMFLLFVLVLSFQLKISSTMREDSLGLPRPSSHCLLSISENLRKQFSNLIKAISEERIFFPLLWVVGSIVIVPNLSGTLFCYQTQCLNLDPSIIGMSKVIGQLILMFAAVQYNRQWKGISMRKLIKIVQIVYATSLLLDLILVKQINLKLGVPNEVYVLCLSGLAETIAQFKLLPFSVLFAKLCPPGCEGSLTSFLASAFCLSSIVSGFGGVALASLIGISSRDYSSLSVGILFQFLAALAPLPWLFYVPINQSGADKGMKIVRRRRNRRRLKW